MLAEVSAKLRKAAGLPAKPTGAVANNRHGKSLVDKSKTPSARRKNQQRRPRDPGRHHSHRHARRYANPETQ
jgi:hypothetical protein